MKFLIPQKKKPKIREKLTEWYRINKRDLPWRDTKDPYAIWVSEVMLQQTRIDTVLSYYQRWMDKFPDILSLANASEGEVLGVWEGLGYYQRALNLHKSARSIINQCKSKIPDSYNELKKLSGVGDYIAGAISSIAFGKKEAALDGNGIRILSRIIGFAEPVDLARNKQQLRLALKDLLPDESPGDFNQALMDLGSIICKSRNPACAICPLREACFAFSDGSQKKYPVKTPKKKIPHVLVVAGVLIRNGKVLIDKRKTGGLLGGLWEFPGGKIEKGEDIEAALQREFKEELGIKIFIIERKNSYKHAYTHFKVTVHTFLVEIKAGKPRPLESEEIRWVNIKNLGDYPMGKVDRSISKDIQLLDIYS